MALVLNALEESVVFFFSPTDLAQKQIPPDRQVRVGGLVEAGSVTRGPGDGEIHFLVTDGATTLPVRFVGVLPDLFREGQGVVAQGRLASGTFEADEVLAKHDERSEERRVGKACVSPGRSRGSRHNKKKNKKN